MLRFGRPNRPGPYRAVISPTDINLLGDIKKVMDLDRYFEDLVARIFLDLVMRCGLSPMEAISYGLTRVLGMSPMDAAGYINALTGKNVTNSQVSVYLQRGIVKLGIDDAIRIQREYRK